MTAQLTVQDALIDQVRDDLPKGWFDRFYFNAHGAASGPYLLMGAGVYPGTRVIDGYAMLVTEGRQRNIRFSESYAGPEIPRSVGPFAFETLQEDQVWRMRLGPNPLGIEFDLTWTARAPKWACAPISVEDRRNGTVSRFGHFFQSGRYEGYLLADGLRTDLSGWLGQRDRSTGTRPVSPGQGAHIWLQAQFPGFVIGFIQDLSRENSQILLDGAVIHETGEVDPIVRSDHALAFDEQLELAPGRLELQTASGRRYSLRYDPATNVGGYLSGGGYGGYHGKPAGRHMLAVSDWELPSEAFNCRRLDTPLTDRLVAFQCETGEGNVISGSGIFEFAHSRSPDYTYRPAI